MKRKNGFTLIELIAVLVIMAIIALIVTPLVMNIIRKARISADKRSIDAYGRSIELAIAGYLMDTGDFPTSISELTIEYTGEEVVCTTTNLNSDSSIYLAGCTVGGRSVENYTYGSDKTPPAPTYTAYEVGDEVTYNNVDYYVIADSSTNEENVQLLKKDPLTIAEVNQFGGVGTANNHVNMYVTQDTSSNYYQQAYDKNGYGGMAYYSSATCNPWGDSSGCTTNYADSEIKYVVDAWKNTAVASGDTATARLITYDDLTDNLGFEKKNEGTIYPSSNGDTPTWVYNSSYYYWTMSQYQDSSIVWCVGDNGKLTGRRVFGSIMVRPVLELSKSANITMAS